MIVLSRLTDPVTVSAVAQNYIPSLSVHSSSSSSTSVPVPRPTAKTQRRHTSTPTQINFSALEAGRQRSVASVLRAQEIEETQSTLHFGPIFDQILLHPTDDRTFHLGLPALIELGNALLEYSQKPPHRGGQEILTPHDQLVLYLLWLSTDTTQIFLTKTTGVNQSTYSRTLDKIRPALHQYLTKRYSCPPRPLITLDEPFPEVALLVDATTITIPTPALSFLDRKTYYDGHHRCYCFKVEVATNPHPPHQALFVSDIVPGSVHDVTLFRMGLERYKVYLRKTLEEKSQLISDSQYDSFAIMADKGYIGTFPNLRIITPVKFRSSAPSDSFDSSIPASFPPASQQSIPTELMGSTPEFQSSPVSATPTFSRSSPTSHTSASTPATPVSPISSQNTLYHQQTSPEASLPDSYSRRTTTTTTTTSSSSVSSTSSSVINPPPFNTPLYPSPAAAREIDIDPPVATENVLIAQHRIPVEWFFGRMKRLWLRIAGKFRGDRDKLPLDIQNACWLTNISIEYKRLLSVDGIFGTQLEVSQRSHIITSQRIAQIDNEARNKRAEARQAMRRSSNRYTSQGSETESDDTQL